MKRSEALAMALEHVTRLAGTVYKNGTTYAANGWKASTLDEQTRAILDFAAFLMLSDSEVLDPAPVRCGYIEIGADDEPCILPPHPIGTSHKDKVGNVWL